MYTDSRGHHITTDVAAAADATRRAIDHLVGRRAAMMPSIEEAVKADGNCLMAHVLNGLMACGARKVAALETARTAHAEALRLAPAATARERIYVDALEHAIAREPEAVVDCHERVLEQHPTDLLASVLVQGELFWTGDMARSEAASARVDAVWTESIEGYADWLALRAFDVEEIGDLDSAEQLGRRSIELDSNNLWGAHAVSHVLEMRGDSAGGIRWLDELKGGWDAGGPMKFHLWWHRCLCHIEQGEHDAALAIHDEWLRNDQQPMMQALPDFYLDVQNGASNLIRLELCGVDVGTRWHALADAIDASWDDLSNPFTTLHVAMILAATDQPDRLASLITAVEILTNDDTSLARACRTAPAMLRAIGAHRRGDHTAVVELAAPVRDALWQLGGSHAQRDVLFQLLFDSARRCGDDTLTTGIARDIERIGFVDPVGRAAYRQPSTLVRPAH